MRKQNFSFAMVGISTGEVLHDRDDVSFKCMVLDDKRVEFEGQDMSLSQSAQIVRERLGLTYATKVQGLRKWMHKGRSLEELRVLAGH